MSIFGRNVDKRKKFLAIQDQLMNNKSFELSRNQAELAVYNQIQDEYVRLSVEDPFSPQAQKLEQNLQLFQDDIDTWRAQNADRLAEWQNGGTLQVAPYAAARMPDSITESNNIVIGVPIEAVKKTYSGMKIQPETIAAYDGIHASTLQNFFTTGLSRDIAKMNVSWEPTQAWVKQGVAANLAALDNIRKHNGNVFTWDLETLGGDAADDGMAGFQRITEFSFSHAVGSFENKSFNIKRTYGSIIGFSQDEYDKAMKLIEMYGNGEKLTKGQLVTLNRLALSGASKTKVDWNNAKNGVVRYANFSEKTDIHGIGSIKEMKAGAKSLLEIGNYQRKNILANGMYGHEQELVSALRHIKESQYTAIGFNTEGFDIRHLDGYLMSLISNPKASTEAFRKEINGILNGEHFNIEHSLDPLHLEWEIGGDPYEFWLNYMDNDKKKTDQLVKWMKDNDEHSRTQQTHLAALAIKNGQNPRDLHFGQAHVAEADAKDVLSIVFGSGLYDTSGADSMLKGKSAKAVKLKANGTMLFHALNSSYNPSKFNLLSFTRDNETGNWANSDGVLFGKKVTGSAGYQIPGIRRRASYALTGAGRITKDDPLYAAAIAQHKNFDGGNLYYFRFNPFASDTNSAAAAHQDVTLVGTLRDLKHYMQGNMVLAATKKNADSSRWQIYRDSLKQLDLISFDENGSLIEKETQISDILGLSDFAFANDAAARKAREKDLRLDKGLISYIDAMDNYVKTKYKGHDEHIIAKHRQTFRDMVWKNTKKVWKAKEKDKNVKLSYKDTLHEFFGHENFEDSELLELFKTTADKMTLLEDYGRKQYDIISQAIKTVTSNKGLNDTEQRFLYKHLRSEIEKAAVAKNGRVGAGFRNHAITKAEYQKYFQVDMEGFWGLHGSDGTKIENINILGGGSNLANSLLRKIGYSQDDLENVKSATKLAVLNRFQQHLLSQGVVSKDDGHLIDVTIDTPDIAGGKIVSMMRKRREQQATAGLLRPTDQHDIVNNIKNAGLTGAEISQTIKDASKLKFHIVTNRRKGKGKVEASYVNKMAADITKNLIYGNDYSVWRGDEEEEDAFVKRLMAESGYSKQNARKIYAMQRLRYQGTYNLMRKVIHSVYENDGAIGYDLDNKSFWIYNSATELNQDTRHYVSLHHNVMTNGSFKRQATNGQQFIDVTGLYHSNKDNGIRLTTVEGRFAHDSEGLISHIISREAESKNLAGGVESVFGIVDQQYRNFATEISGDLTDRQNANAVYIGDVWQYLIDLGQTEREKIAKQLKETKLDGGRILGNFLQDEKALSRFKNNPLSMQDVNTIKDMGTTMATALLQTAHIWQPHVLANINGNRKIIDTLIDSSVSFQNVYSQGGDTRGLITVLPDDAEEAIAQLTPGTNHAETKRGRALYFDANRAAEILKGQDATIGRSFSTVSVQKQMAAKSKDLGYAVDTTIAANKLTASTKDMRRIMKTAIEQFGLDENSYAAKEALSLTTDEGSGAISARMADALFQNSAYEQHIKFTKVAQSNIENNKNYRKLLAINPKITFDKDGKIHYHSGASVMVRQGDMLPAVSNDPLYGDNNKVIKETGLLKVGVFKNNTRLTDEAVSDILNKNLKLDASLSREEKELAVFNWLEKENTHGLSFDFHLKAAEISGQAKAMDYLEKEMLHIIMPGMGQADDKIANTLKKLGGKKMIGKKMHLDIIQELAEKNTVKGTDFFSYIIGLGDLNAAEKIAEKGKEDRAMLLRMSAEQADAVIKEHFGSVSDFAQALLKERYGASDTMSEMLIKTGFTDKIVHVYGDTRKATEKHRQATIFEATVNELKNSLRMSSEEILKVFKENEVASGGLSISKDAHGQKQIVFNVDRGELDYLNLKKVIDKYFGNEDGWHSITHKVKLKNGENVQYEVARSSYLALPNFDRGQAANNGMHDVKLDGRAVDSLKSSVYTQHFLDRSTEEVEKIFGKDNDFTKKLVKIYSSKADGDVVNSAFLKDILEKTYAHEGDPKHVAGGQVLYQDGEKIASEEGYAWLEKQGVDRKTAEQWVEDLAEKSGAPKITANKVLNYVEASTGALAHNFNLDRRHTISELQNMGFGLETIDSVSANAYVHKKVDKNLNSIFGQAMVIDLHSEALEDGQIYNGVGDRYLAIGFSPLQATDDNGASRKSEVQRKFSRFMNDYYDYRENYQQRKDGNLNGEKLKSLQEQLADIKETVSQTVSNKKGALRGTTVAHYTDGVSYGTAHGFQFLGFGLDGAFQHMKFVDSGLSFSHLAEKRNAKETVADIGYMIANAKARDLIYTDEMFENLAGGDKELAKQLKKQTFEVLDTEGTIGTEGRSPYQALDSVQASNIHFSDRLGKDEFVVNQKTFKQQNGDFDSDKLAALIQKSKAKITYANGKTASVDLDFAAYRALQGMGVHVQLLDNKFDEAKAAIVHNALEITPYAQMPNTKRGVEGGVEGDMLSTEYLEEGTYDGRHSPIYSRTYSAEERATHDMNLTEFENKFREAKGENPLDYEEKDYVQKMGEFLTGNYDKESDEYNKYKEALHFRKWQQGWNERISEAASKKDAGILNKGLYELSRIVHDRGNLTGEETALFQLGRMALEEGALTGKNNRGKQDIERSKKIVDTFSAALYAMSSGRNVDEAAENLKTVITDVFEGRTGKEFSGRLNPEIYGTPEEQAQKAADVFTKVVRTIPLNRKEQTRLKLGVSKTGLSASEELMYSSIDVDDPINQAADVINRIAAKRGVSSAVFKDSSNDRRVSVGNAVQGMATKMRNELENDSSAQQEAAMAVGKAAANSHNGLRKIASFLGNGSKAAAAAIGIAAGLMTAGYASSTMKHDVPTPAQTQAMYVSNDENAQVQMQQVNSLADSNLNVMRGGPNAGYVININAKTSQGQQAAVSAITNAASGMIPQNGSVNVNVNTSMSDSISQLQVNRMVAHAIGIA